MKAIDSRRALRHALKTHRLDHGLSLIKLAQAIHRVTTIRISPPTLVRFMENERLTHERNIHAIRKYLASFEEIKL